MTHLELLRWWHAPFCWRLAHDDTVRLWSVDQNTPTLWGHLRWMAAHLKGKERGALIISDEQKPVGVYTSAVCRDGIVVGISLLPSARGKGHAEFTLKCAAMSAYMHALPLYALIKPGNHRSRGAFERAGFWLSGTTDDGMPEGVVSRDCNEISRCRSTTYASDQVISWRDVGVVAQSSALIFAKSSSEKSR